MKRASALALSFIFGILFTSCGGSSSRDRAISEVQKREIVRAVEIVEVTLGSMQDGGGYQKWTPGKAVEKLVPLLNSASAPMEGEPEPPGISGKIRYVEGKVTAPWQIVLTADDKQKKIRVEGFGADTTQAVHTREIAVSEW